MFKVDVKTQVNNKFKELFGKTLKPVVTGQRLSPHDCVAAGIKGGAYDGMYVTEVTLDGQLICTAQHRDWRKAYKLLKLEVENRFAEGKPLP